MTRVPPVTSTSSMLAIGRARRFPCWAHLCARWGSSVALVSVTSSLVGRENTPTTGSSLGRNAASTSAHHERMECGMPSGWLLQSCTSKARMRKQCNLSRLSSLCSLGRLSSRLASGTSLSTRRFACGGWSRHCMTRVPSLRRSPNTTSSVG